MRSSAQEKLDLNRQLPLSPTDIHEWSSAKNVYQKRVPKLILSLAAYRGSDERSVQTQRSAA